MGCLSRWMWNRYHICPGAFCTPFEPPRDKCPEGDKCYDCMTINSQKDQPSDLRMLLFKSVGLPWSYYHSFVDALWLKMFWCENSNQSFLSVQLDLNQGETKSHFVMLIQACKIFINDCDWTEINTPVDSWINQLWLFLNQGKSLGKTNQLACTSCLKIGALGLFINLKRVFCQDIMSKHIWQSRNNLIVIFVLLKS